MKTRKIKTWPPAAFELPGDIDAIERGRDGDVNQSLHDDSRAARLRRLGLRVAADLIDPPQVQRELFTFCPASWELTDAPPTQGAGT